MPNYPTLIPKTSLQGTDIQYEGMAGCGKGQGQTPGPPQRRAGQVQARRQGGRDSREAEVLVSAERANSKKRCRPERRCEFPALPFLLAAEFIC